MRPPLREEGFPGFSIAEARHMEFMARLHFHALPPGHGGAFHDHRPRPLPGFDGEDIGRKPQVFQQGIHGALGLRQSGYGEVRHTSAAAQVEAQEVVPPAERRFHGSPPQHMEKEVAPASINVARMRRSAIGNRLA